MKWRLCSAIYNLSTILIFLRFSFPSLVASLLNRYNVEHVRSAETSVKPIYIRTSTLLVVVGNITTIFCLNYITSLLSETFIGTFQCESIT